MEALASMELVHGSGNVFRDFGEADFSRVRNAAYGRFTLDRLIRMLGALGP